ncbi:MAG TPA: response regulator transcription factor [Jatrophihabitantaceae bacterium]|jgi:two-component system OmpR family response regulator
MANDNPAPSSAAHDGARVLVDDEVAIADLLVAGLRLVGFDVRAAHTGAEAHAVAAEFRPHLLVLDVMLPDVDGFELSRELRRNTEQIGVVFLTARDRDADALTGLAIGADDYISKPFSLEEVLARVRVVLRRIAPANPLSAVDQPAVLRFADLELSEDLHEVRRSNNVIEVSPTEFALLRYLLKNGGRVVSKAQILAHVWGYDYHGANDGIVDSYISQLEKKIDRFDPPLIHTSGTGYSLRVGRAAVSEGMR